METTLKPLSDQVIVITGASSGIGLATAYMAAEKGARVVLASRNESALEAIVNKIREKGGKAIHVVTDVTKRDDLDHLVDRAIRTFGGFDTWVNNAGLSIFGRLEEVTDEDHRRLFDVNFWGLVDGSCVAAAHLRRKGGSIINLGSVASDLAFPVQGMYCASKHAIKGFTDALRLELRGAGAPISVTLIKPASINTPFPVHAKNYLNGEPTLPPPIYQPEDVAKAILYAAEHGGRDYYIGGGGKAMTSLNKRWPAIADWFGLQVGKMQSSGLPKRGRDGSLNGPAQDGDVHGETNSMVRNSLYTAAQTGPIKSLAIAAVGGMCLAFLAAPRPARSYPRIRRTR